MGAERPFHDFISGLEKVGIGIIEAIKLRKNISWNGFFLVSKKLLVNILFAVICSSKSCSYRIFRFEQFAVEQNIIQTKFQMHKTFRRTIYNSSRILFFCILRRKIDNERQKIFWQIDKHVLLFIISFAPSPAFNLENQKLKAVKWKSFKQIQT